jgi:hypothetical protein
MREDMETSFRCAGTTAEQRLQFRELAPREDRQSVDFPHGALGPAVASA